MLTRAVHTLIHHIEELEMRSTKENRYHIGQAIAIAEELCNILEQSSAAQKADKEEPKSDEVKSENG